VLALLGRVAKPGDAVEWRGWTFELAAIDGLAIESIVARPKPAAAASASGHAKRHA
jgi:hypothetical protein